MRIQILHNDETIWESDIYEGGSFPDSLSSGLKRLIEEKGSDILNFSELHGLIESLKAPRSQNDEEEDVPFPLNINEEEFYLKHREGVLICLQSIYEVFARTGLQDLKVRIEL